MVNVGCQGHRGQCASELGLFIVALDHYLKMSVGPILILNSLHGQPPDPVEGCTFARAGHAHQDDAFLLDLHDPAVATL